MDMLFGYRLFGQAYYLKICLSLELGMYRNEMLGGRLCQVQKTWQYRGHSDIVPRLSGQVSTLPVNIRANWIVRIHTLHEYI